MAMKKGFKDDYLRIREYLENTTFGATRLVFCERIDEKSHVWNFNRHCHDYTEFIYILDGNMQIDVPGKKLSKGFYNLVVYPKNVLHQELVNMQEHQAILCIGVATVGGDDLRTAFEIADDDGAFRWLMEQIYLENQQRKTGNETVINAYITALYIKMQRYFEDTTQRQHDFVSRCICYINDHILEDLNIEQLSAVAYVSPSHLTRSFRQKVGCSPLNYIRACRINIARHELIASPDNIEEVALRAGFHDPKYFSRVFKLETGLSPREYRLSHAENENGNENGREHPL